MSKIIDIKTKLPRQGDELVLIPLDNDCRAKAENNKYIIYVKQFDVYVYSKKKREIDLLGNIKLQGAKATNSIQMILNNHLLVIIDKSNMFISVDFIHMFRYDPYDNEDEE